MKKIGFTLAELLVTLGIIGVIAALIIPAINHLKPNKNKVLCLKAYDTLTETVKSIASNSKLYPICGGINDNDNIKCTEYPLFNLNEPKETRFQGKQNSMYQGDRKLCDLLAFAMGISENNNHCSTEPYTFASNTFNNYFDNHISFSSNNGMQWMIVPAIASTAVSRRGTFQTDVYVDVNGSAEPNCIYSENCKKPDRFKFIINANGYINIADSVANEYITTRKNLSKNASETLNAAITAQGQKRNFDYELCNAAENGGNQGGGDDGNQGGGGVGNGAFFARSGESVQYRKNDMVHGKKEKCTLKDDYSYMNTAATVNTNSQYEQMLSTFNQRLNSCENYVTKPFFNELHITIMGASKANPYVIKDKKGNVVYSCSSSYCPAKIIKNAENIDPRTDYIFEPSDMNVTISQ